VLVDLSRINYTIAILDLQDSQSREVYLLARSSQIFRKKGLAYLSNVGSGIPGSPPCFNPKKVAAKDKR